MVSFSKPAAEVEEPSQSAIPAKRKRVLNPKLTSEDNVSADAIKRRKHEASTNPGPKTTQKKNTSARQTSLAFTPAQASHTAPTLASQKASQSKSIPRNNWQASVEEADDDEVDPIHRHAGPPKNPNAIIEAANGSDDMDIDDDNDVPELVVDDDEEDEDDEDDEDEVQEEIDEHELSNLFINKNSHL